MNMKSAFSTALLGVSMLLAQSSFGQSAQNDKPSSKTDTSFTQTTSPVPIYKLDNQKSTKFTYQTIPGMEQNGLAFDATGPTGQVESFSTIIPSREDLKKFGATNYNAIIAPVAWALENKASFGIDMYGRSEYASFVISKDKRALLTDKLLNDADALKKFLNEKGTITEIDRGMTMPYVLEMFKQNENKNAPIDKDKGVAFGLAGQ